MYLKTGYRPLLWSAAALLLLLFFAVPGLNLLTVLLLTVPCVVLYATLPPLSFAIHIAVVWLVGYVAIGPAALLIGFFFLMPAIVIGHLYKRRATARTVITLATITILAQFLLELLLFSVIFDFHLIAEMKAVMESNVGMMEDQGVLNGWSGSTTDALIDSIMRSLPVTLIIFSFVMAAVTHALARRALRGSELEVQAFRRAKDWMLPKSFVFLYLVVMLLDMMMPEKDNTYMSDVVINLLPLLRFAFTIQTIGFFFFLAAQKSWPRIVSLLISIPVVLFPPLSLIGVLDVAFPIRKSFTKP